MDNLLKLYQSVFGAGSYEVREAEYFPEENREPLRAYLKATLNERHYVVIANHCIDGKKQAEIASELGVSRQNVSQLFLLAIEKLKASPAALRYYLIPSAKFMGIFTKLIDENIDLKRRLELQELVIKGLKEQIPGQDSVELSDLEQLLELDIWKLNIETRLSNALLRYGIKTVREMLELEPKEIKRIRWIGEKGYQRLAKKAKELIATFPELEGKVTLLKGS